MELLAVELIQSLLDVLPDNIEHTEECWDQCWNTLNNDAQVQVTRARMEATDYLEGNEIRGIDASKRQ